MTSFWNNLHQVHSKSENWKVKLLRKSILATCKSATWSISAIFMGRVEFTYKQTIH